jgi:adenosylcobinamide kinase / adenosylcobinamide-phosphate guanylyltransferase
VAKELILVLGGARSGKSSYAEALAEKLASELSGERGVLYVATAQAWDDEMRARIVKHREDRPATWRTVEVPTNAGAAAAAASEGERVVLLDCMTLLTSNVVIALPEGTTAAEAESAALAEAQGILAAYRAGDASWIVVSNEVGLGIVPAYPLGRLYRDALGRVNQKLAAEADRVLFMVAGLPMKVK